MYRFYRVRTGRCMLDGFIGALLCLRKINDGKCIESLLPADWQARHNISARYAQRVCNACMTSEHERPTCYIGGIGDTPIHRTCSHSAKITYSASPPTTAMK